jgi:spore coat polysaccharide biosynthesis protein SpsF (cytidylyltransferase family)
VTPVVALLQARMGSTRLPGKVLAPIEGRSLLEQLVRRLRSSARLSSLVLATTTRPDDDVLAAAGSALGLAVFRGSETDVLDRLASAARTCAAATVVRLTADNPLVDGAFVDFVVDRYAQGHETTGVAYAETTTSGAFPYGLSVEVMSRAALEAAAASATSPHDREHVTPWIRRQCERFPGLALAADVPSGDLRWTVDTAEDLARMRALFATLKLSERPLSYQAIIRHQRASAGGAGPAHG